MRRSFWRFALALVVTLGAPVRAQRPESARPTVPARQEPQDFLHHKFEHDIRRFEQLDRELKTPTGVIVFVGSSSIRYWHSLPRDFPDARVLNRGFGGSQFHDITFYAPRIIVPYRPRAVVVYSGENDLHEGKSPEQVHADFRALVELLHAELPGVPIAVISIKPSPCRRPIWGKVRRTNAMIRHSVSHDRLLVYLDVHRSMVDRWGQPRTELFLDDGLHLNRRGYAIWKRAIDEFLGTLDEPSPPAGDPVEMADTADRPGKAGAPARGSGRATATGRMP